MLVAFIIILIILSILIVASILLQEDKAHGGIGILGGSSQSFFGASSGSLLAKFSSIALTLFVLLAVITAIYCAREYSPISSKKIKEAEISNVINKNQDFLKNISDKENESSSSSSSADNNPK